MKNIKGLKYYIFGASLGVFCSLICSPVLADYNTDMTKTEPITKEEYVTGVIVDDYYDCNIPYNKTFYSIGGFSESNADSSYNMPTSMYNDYVGSRVGILDGADIGFEESGEIEGLKTYGVGQNDLIALSLPKFCFRDEALVDLREVWGYENIGKLADIVLADGTCYHGFIADLETPSFYNTSAEMKNFYECPVMKSVGNFWASYDFLFNSINGEVFRVAGEKENCLTEQAVKGNRVAYIRVYNEYASDYQGAIGSTVEKIDLLGDVEVGLSDLADELEPMYYYNDYSEDEAEPGMGNAKWVKSKFYFSTTKSIVEKHVTDFTDKESFERVMKQAGGYKKYVESLGGVFAVYAGKKQKVTIKTLGDLHALYDYVYGLIAIWGFNYACNNESSRFTPWGCSHWSGGSKYSIWGGKGKVNSTAWAHNWRCVDDKCSDNVDSGVMATTMCNGTVRCLEKKATNFSYHGKTLASKANGDSRKDFVEKVQTGCVMAQPGHIWAIGDVTDAYIEVFTTGHDLTNPAKNRIRYKKSEILSGKAGGQYFNPNKYSSLTLWKGGHRYKSDDPNPSVEIPGEGKISYTDTGKTEESSQDSNVSSQGNWVTAEENIPGLKGEIHRVSDDASVVELPDGSDLDSDERISVQVVKDNKSARQENLLAEILGTAVISIGLLILVYITLLWVFYIFDKANTLFTVSMIRVITLGRYEVSDEGNKDSLHEMTLQRMIITSLIAFIVSWAIISGGIFIVVQELLNFIKSLF